MDFVLLRRLFGGVSLNYKVTKVFNNELFCDFLVLRLMSILLSQHFPNF